MSDLPDLKKLREVAEKATPGPWWIDSHGSAMISHGADQKTVFIADPRIGKATRNEETGNLSHWPNDWDATYIATFNPQTILALLDAYEASVRDAERLRKENEGLRTALFKFVKDAEELNLGCADVVITTCESLEAARHATQGD